MKTNINELKKIISGLVKEQLEQGEVEAEVSQEPEEEHSSSIKNIESLFEYIMQQVKDKNFVMAKRFVDNLKEEIEEMEKRVAGLAMAQNDEAVE